ncbi:MAG: DUF2029 domain-containing protein [Acidobacteriia bacterium]|nr:DUF2029 domain-containing protein [Terriglobia bacterium]
MLYRSRSPVKPQPLLDDKGSRLIWLGMIVIGLLLAAGWLVVAIEFSQTGWDFTEFYIAASVPVHSLYDRAVATAFGTERLAPLGISYFPPFVRPAVFSLLLRPLAVLDYWPAFWVFAGFGLLAYVLSLVLLFRQLHLSPFQIPCFVAFFPAMFGLVTGQDATVFLFVLIIGWLLLLRRHETAAGCVFALCLYKFNLVLLIPALLWIWRLHRALVWFVIGVILLVVTSAALTPLSDYLALLENISGLTVGFVPGGLRGFLIRFGLGKWYPLCAVPVVLWCLFLVHRLPLSDGFWVAIVGTLLSSPHATWYDCTLLVPPMALAWLRGGLWARSGVLLLCFPFLWIFGKVFTEISAEIFLLGFFVRSARGFTPSAVRIEESKTTN